MRRTIVFDVIETLLDLKALDSQFDRTFGDATARTEWFQQSLQLALVSTVTGAYSDFTSVGKAALEMTAQRRSVALSDEDATLIIGGVRDLPAHPDVREALQRLQYAGLRLAALTNSTQDVAEAQLGSAGLRPFFEQVFSADSVQRLKPAPEPYRFAAEGMGVSVGEIRMVAAHAWDIAGATRVGCAAAFVAREGKVLDPLVTRPDIVGADLGEVAERVLQVERS